MSVDRLRALIRVLISEGMDPADAAVEASRMLSVSNTPSQSEQAAAYEQYMESELRDPTGAYSEGGLTAGGIFGNGAIDFTDHDSSARQRSVATRSQMMGAKALAEQTEMLRLKAQVEAQTRVLAEMNAKMAQLTAGREAPPDDGVWDDPGPGKRRRRHR